MPRKSQEISVAWAMRVSLAQLGARLTAYVATKPHATMLRLALQKSPLKVCHDLPEEMLTKIIEEIRESKFQQEMNWWIKLRKCLGNECDLWTHASSCAIDVALEYYGEMNKDKVLSILNDDRESSDAHLRAVERYSKTLMAKGKSKLAKCIKIFTQDYGIRPYFSVQISRRYWDDHCEISGVDAKAYLTLPIVQARNKSKRGPNLVSLAIEEVVDPSTLAALAQGLTEAQSSKFLAAAKVMNLHPYNPEEDESMYEERSKKPYHSNWYRNLNGERDVDTAAEVGASDAEKSKEKEKEKEKKEADYTETWPKLMFLGCAVVESYEVWD